MGKSPRHDPVPALEWAAAAIGLLVALALLAVLLREALAGGPRTLPALSAEAVRVEPGSGGHSVGILVRNVSPQTAAGVQVEGVLMRGGTEVETSSATVDYVPGHSSTKAGLLFRQDPRAHQLELRVTGYELP